MLSVSSVGSVRGVGGPVFRSIALLILGIAIREIVDQNYTIIALFRKLI